MIDMLTTTLAVQVGYTIADVLAKPIFGLYIFAIAKAKTEADQEGVVVAN